MVLLCRSRAEDEDEYGRDVVEWSTVAYTIETRCVTRSQYAALVHVTRP